MGRTLAIDIETYSDVDLISCGVYKYGSRIGQAENDGRKRID